jgi:rhodanese-related sulfurtransferase
MIMKGVVVSTILLFLLTATTAFAGASRDITSVEAKKMLDRSRNIYLLDVRTPDERRQGYIPGSVLIPIDMVERRISEIPKNKTVIVYCAVGSRSRPVAQALARSGYPEVYNMKDGIFGWYRNGLPVQR